MDHTRESPPSESSLSGPASALTSASASSSASGSLTRSASAETQLRLLSAEELAASFDAAVLVDVRPFSDYTVGHIRGAVSVRLSSILIRRLATGKIACVDIVIDEQKECFRQLTADPRCMIVVYDENAPATADPTAVLADTKSPLAIVAKSLCRSSSSVAVLQVSFSAFQSSYPQLVERTIADELAPALLSPPVPTPAEVLADRSPCVSVRDSVPSEILPYMFVGSQSHAQSREIIESFGFTHVLNITSTCPNRFPDRVVYKTINIRDTWNQNIASYFDQAFEFIESAKSSGGKILIHCVAGISRSPTITIAYLMKSNGWSLCEALSFVKSKRSIVSPNLDFLVELQSFERLLFPSMGPLPPITSPDTQLLLGPGYPCMASCGQPITSADTASLAVTMQTMECENAETAQPPRAAQPVSAAPDSLASTCSWPIAQAGPAGATVATSPGLPPRTPLLAPSFAGAAALFSSSQRSSPLATNASGFADVSAPLSAGCLPPPQTPWVLSHAGSAPSLALTPAAAQSSAHPLSYGTNSVSETRLSAENINRRSGSVSEGCSPRLKSPFQAALTATVARTSPKAPRRDPQSPFVSSPSSQGIFVL